MKKIIFAICILYSFTFSGSNPELDKTLEKCKKSYIAVKDYMCNFSRKELVNGRMREEKNVIFKFMKPAHFYMKWTEGENEDMESFYVEGKHNSKLIVKPSGLFSFLRVAVDPNGKKALEKNRHPIYEADLGHFVDLFEREYQKSKVDKFSIINFEPDQVIKGRPSTVIKAVFPENKGYYGHLVYIFIDKYYNLPIKVTVYDWKNNLVEEYQYDDLRINCGLTENDFQTREPDINY